MEILEYLKDKKNKKVGVLFAENGENDEVRIGYSKCHQKLDTFDKDIGIDIARGRAKKHSNSLFDRYQIPYMVQRKFPDFIERCRRYFKDKKLPKWAKKSLK